MKQGMTLPKTHGAVVDYRKDIDGLRAIAVLAVFFFHLYPVLLPGGFLGVDVFFVISGYLITSIILRENACGVFSFKRFYARRVKRIFPALFVVLILSSLLAFFLLAPETYLNFVNSARDASAQFSNFFFARKVGYFEENLESQPLLHTWSLGVEEQFYLFWPLLIYFCFRFVKLQRKKISGQPFPENFDKIVKEDTCCQRRMYRFFFIVFLLLAVLSYVLCVLFIDMDRQKAFYMFYTRAWEFCIGGCVSLPIFPSIKRKDLGALVGGTGLFLLGFSFHAVDQNFLGISFLQFGALLPCLGAALLMYANCKLSIGNRLLATVLPAGIGKISYSLYLYHWPVIIFYKIFNNNHEITPSAALIIISVSFVLAFLSYIFIEQPVRKLETGDNFILGCALVVMIVFSTGFSHLKRYERASWRGADYPNKTDNPPLQIPKSCVPNIKDHFVSLECKVSGKKEAPVIALVGDSHAPHYLSALVSWASHNGYDVLFLGVAGCPMLLGDVKIESLITVEHEVQCSQALPFFAAEIVTHPRVTTILMAQRFDLFHNGKGYLSVDRKIFFKNKEGRRIENHTEYYRDRFADTVRQIRKAGKEPVILQQVPLLNSVSACTWEPRLKKILSQTRDCDYDEQFFEKWQRQRIDFLNEFAALNHIPVFDTFLCMTDPLNNNINMYRDIDHLNEYGSQFLTSCFSDALDTIMSDIKKNTTSRSQSVQ